MKDTKIYKIKNNLNKILNYGNIQEYLKNHL